MKEREFQSWVIDVARRCGWTVYHVPTPMQPTRGGRFVPSKRGAGLPDLILFHTDPPRLIFAEIKNASGVLSDEQRDFLRLARGVANHVRAAFEEGGPAGARHAPVGVYTWRPGVEAMIEAVLRGKTLTS